MSEYLVEKTLDAARSHLGMPFRHHFKPDECLNGTITIETCMLKGMDDSGYDCSGLVIASICDVLNLQTIDWPMSFRHLNQLKSLADDNAPQVGDAIVYEVQRENKLSQHIGIYIAKRCVVHASGISKIVEEGEVEGEILGLSRISNLTLIEIARA